jgi:hypothetical protein
LGVHALPPAFEQTPLNDLLGGSKSLVLVLKVSRVVSSFRGKRIVAAAHHEQEGHEKVRSQ